MNPKSKWTPVEIHQLKSLRESGKTNQEIADTLGRTYRAVTGQLRKSAPTAPVAPAAPATYQEDKERADEDHWRKRFQQLQGKYEKAIHENSVVDALVDDIKSIAPKSYYSAPNIIRSGRSSSGKSQSAVLLFSDTHVGQVITPDQTLGFGMYNFDVFLERLKYLEESTISILTNHTTVKIDELVVAMLGDMLHGNLNHAAEAGQHVTLFEQFYAAGHAIAQFLRNLSAHVPAVRIQTVVGNHTRWGTQHKMPTENRFSNLDMFLYALVEALTRDIPKIKWNLNRQPFQVFEVQGFVFRAAHGDHLKGGDRALGIPNHAIGREVSTTSQLFAKHGQTPPHYYLCGHLHRGIQLPHATGEIIINGGFPGLDNYALAGNFNPVDPMQRLMFVHPKFGRTAEYPLSLKFADTEGVVRPYSIPAI